MSFIRDFSDAFIGKPSVAVARTNDMTLRSDRAAGPWVPRNIMAPCIYQSPQRCDLEAQQTLKN
jgi:hypothetical protein